MNLEIKLKHVFWLVILSITWGANYLFIKIAVNGIDPLTTIAIRGISASAFMLIALPLMGKHFWKYFTHYRMQITSIIGGVLISFMWYTMAQAETVLSASLTSLLIALLPIFAWFISTFIYHEKPFYSLNVVGIIIALMGIIVMIDVHSVVEGRNDLLYILLYATGLAAFTVSAALSSHSCRHTDAFITVTFTIFYTTLFSCLAAVIFGHPATNTYTWANVLSATGTGIISTGIGYLIYYWLVAHAGQLFAASNAYLVPISGFILGVMLLNEPAYLHQIIGLMIVFGGIYLTNKKAKQK